MLIDPSEKTALLSRMRQNAPLLENKTSRARICIYGDNGVGKTVAAVGMARKLIGPDKQIIFVDKTEGYESLRNHKSLVPNVRPISFESVEQLYVLAETIYAEKEPFGNVGAIILDDFDLMTAEDLNILWHNRVALGTSKLDPEKPERPEYLKLGFRTTEVLDFVLNQTPSVHLFLTAHMREKKTPDGQTVLKVFPGFNPALASEIGSRMLVIGHMTGKYVPGGEKNVPSYAREIQVHPTTIVDAKSRVGCGKIKYEIGEFVQHIYEWSVEGRPQDNEADAIRMEIKTSKVETADDEIFGSPTEVDDDTPVMME